MVLFIESGKNNLIGKRLIQKITIAIWDLKIYCWAKFQTREKELLKVCGVFKYGHKSQVPVEESAHWGVVRARVEKEH